jgi:hypothetical protein
VAIDITRRPSVKQEHAMTSLRFKAAATAVTLTAFVSMSAPALAQGTAEQRSACMRDAFHFCFRAIPNVSKIENCLAQNVSRLRPACAAEFTSRGRTPLQRRHFANN